MGWTVLYTAFAVVALWLLGEVLLQYKARLRWRLLAFAGFSTVVVGVVALSSVVVIGLGAAAFAVGQTFVTLSYRRGFSTGWALGGMPGSSRRRRRGTEPPLEGADADPVLEVSGVEEHDVYEAQAQVAYGPEGHDAYEAPAYERQPLPEETGEYGIYDRGESSPYAPAASYQEQAGDYAYASGFGADYGQQEQHQYAPYADPYLGYDSGQYAATASYDASYHAYGAGYGGQDSYAGTGYDAGHDTYGGAWVPQQREADQQVVTEQPYVYRDSYGDGGNGANGAYGAGYGRDDAYAQGYGYDYPYAENGYGADGYGHGNGNDAGAQGYDPATGRYGYDEQRGY